MSEEIKRYSEMSRSELLEVCRRLYAAGGINALSYHAIKAHATLYENLYRNGLSQKVILNELNLNLEYKTYKATLPLIRNGRAAQRWPWPRIVEEAKAVSDREGMLPPAAWFQSNGYGSLVQAVYNLNRTWEDLRDALGDFSRTSFIQSRNGMRWRSHPEASFSNFLYARGIEHRRGERYPDEYAKSSDQRYGYYDVHFLDQHGEWIDVEIWGDKPGGHNEAHYGRKRAQKEAFNAGRPTFLGIHFQACFDDDKLGTLLQPYIGTVAPFRFDRAADPKIPSTHWSNTDELLEYCASFAERMPDGQFPTEEWLRKRGKWATRDGDAFNTLSIYIKTWFGGIRNLRRLLGQAHFSTIQWDKVKATEAFQQFYDRHGLTPEQARHKYRNASAANKAILDKANRICAAINKYAGGVLAVQEELGIVPDKARKWTKEAVLDGYRQSIEKWRLSPLQVRQLHRQGALRLTEEEYQRLGQLIDATPRQFSSVYEIYKLLHFTPPSSPRRRKKQTAGDQDRR